MTAAGSAGPRVLHGTLMSTFEPGVYQQLAWEKQAAEAEQLPWDTRIFTSLTRPDPASVMVRWQPRGRVETTRLGRWLAFRRAYYAWLEEQAPNYDVVLLRHSPYDPLRAGAIRSLTRMVGAVGSVHHTFEVPELLYQRPRAKGVMLSTGERVLGPRNIAAADLIVAVTPEIAAHQNARIGRRLPTLVYPNGTLLDETIEDRRGEVPEVLFVAGTFQPWHGLDLLLESLRATTEEFTLHVVGRVDPGLADRSSDPRVTFHGVLDADQIRALNLRSWVGVSSLALERQRMTQATPLKVREYLSLGLPVYAGHRDVFPVNSTVFHVGRPDVSEVLRFAHHTRQVPRTSIRDEAASYIDKRALIRGLHTSLASLVGQPAS